MRPQYRCSSNVLIYNASIFVKSRPSYLIVDIEPVVDKNQQSNDQSYFSVIKDYASYGECRLQRNNGFFFYTHVYD